MSKQRPNEEYIEPPRGIPGEVADARSFFEQLLHLGCNRFGYLAVWRVDRSSGCLLRQRSSERFLNLEDFRREYGRGTYQLEVYDSDGNGPVLYLHRLDVPGSFEMKAPTRNLKPKRATPRRSRATRSPRAERAEARNEGLVAELRQVERTLFETQALARTAISQARGRLFAMLAFYVLLIALTGFCGLLYVESHGWPW